MRPIPKKMKEDILNDPAYHVCMRNAIFNDHICQGRLTLEHAIIHGGKQVNEKWAIMSLCAWAHDVDQYQDGGNIDKRKNEYCCIIRATEEDLAKYPKRDWAQFRAGLIAKYGLPKQPTAFTLF